MRSIKALVVAVFLFVALTSMAARSDRAEAAFPGTNGQIAFASLRTGAHVWLMNPDGSSQTMFNDKAEYEPAWSADGSKLAWIGISGGWDIFTLNADGSDVHNLTSWYSHNDVNPTWSPDGSKIIFRQDALHQLLESLGN